MLDFYHMVREGFNMRSCVSQSTDNKWCYGPPIQAPIVGAIQDGNKQPKIRWLVKESNRKGGVDDHISIDKIKCSREPLEVGDHV